MYIFTGQDGNLAELEAKLEELQKDHDALIAQKSKTDSLLQQCQQQLQGCSTTAASSYKLKLIFCTKIGDVMNLYPRNNSSTLKQLNLRL